MERQPMCYRHSHYYWYSYYYYYKLLETDVSVIHFLRQVYRIHPLVLNSFMERDIRLYSQYLQKFKK